MMAPLDRWTHDNGSARETSSGDARIIFNEINDAGEDACAPVNKVALRDLSRQRGAALIRCAFPAASDQQTAKLAAEFLACSPRTVLNWLSCENSMSLDAVFAIGCKIGVFAVMQVMTMGQGRADVLGLITRGVRRAFGR